MSEIIRLDEVDSTQVVARELVYRGASHGTCVVSRRQTAGRGRLGREWINPDEGLFLSMVLRPACLPAEAPRLTLGAAAGVLAALIDLGVPAFVKWPNDVVVTHSCIHHGKIGPFRKVAGILVEAVETRDRLEAAVLGIGVNLLAPREGWPVALSLLAGSLVDVGFRGDGEQVLEAIVHHVPLALEQALSSFNETRSTLERRSATLGRRVQIDDGNNVVAGIARRLDASGALVVVDDRNVEHIVRAGDVWLDAISSDPS